ncbi:MAG TPA: c-type cytochrome [Acetobacteraceae bacterium]|nr:c-type cytochrome [Acetobacteraceae bacterium]
MIRGHRLLIGMLLLATLNVWPGVPRAQDTDHPPDTMAARMRACVPCHGVQGQGTSNDYFPRLAGKPEQYLFNQLVAFHQGRRHYAPMNYLLQYQTESYLHDMAAYFAAQPLPSQPTSLPAVVHDVLVHGQSLVAKGDYARGIPPCSACHGQSFSGMQPGIPGLVGLKPDYISAQLGAFRYGTRTAIAPDCMQQVAARLTDRDVTAVAAYLASLPVTAGTTPLPAGTLRTPLPCGSEQQ